MSLYNGPARGGNRGGKDQFNWDSVKSDKDREFYLGHSVKATTGRWQKGKDVFWYTREKQEEEAAKARLEMQAIKQREEDLMNEALGLKPKTLKHSAKPKLDSQDMAKLLGRTESEEQGQPDPSQDPEAVKGLGYAPNMMTGVQSAGHEVLGGIGVDGDAAGGPSQPGTGEQLPGPPPRLTQADMERMLKDQKKAVTRAHKAAKKARKAAKKAKKAQLKDIERLQHAQPAEPSGRYQPAGASDSSISSEHESPPGHHRHKSDDREDQHERSYNRDVSEHCRDKLARPDTNGRHQHHARASQSPGRHHAADSGVPGAERRRQMIHRTNDSQKMRHRQSDTKQHQARYGHSASPPRRRYRTRSPA
ncbi:hypothetical protein ABBQ32_005227 [Trebouxia sp. C0010 RCD-2024]